MPKVMPEGWTCLIKEHNRLKGPNLDVDDDDDDDDYDYEKINWKVYPASNRYALIFSNSF
jgi:hypothetical protein